MTYQTKEPIPCTICGSKSVARHLCKRHYYQIRATGNLSAHSLVTPREGFEAKIKKTKTCWLWTGTKNEYGYGIFLLNNHSLRAHRMSYEYYVGAIPKDKVVMHICDNPPCVNPAHLQIGTKSDNNKDTSIKRRHNYGLAHWNGRLSDADVAAIRSSTEKQSILAKRYGVTQSHISRLKANIDRTRTARL